MENSKKFGQAWASKKILESVKTKEVGVDTFMEIALSDTKGRKEKIKHLLENPPSPGDWSRPVEWLPLPMPAAESQTFYGLLAVYELSDNYVALYVNGTEDYRVDWGDGTVETVTAGTKAQHSYNYSDIPSSTFYSPNKYRQVVVSVSMLNNGDMTEFSLDQIHDNSTYSPTPWLDINLNAPNVTDLYISPDGDTFLPMLQRAGLYQIRSVISLSQIFRYCYQLNEVEITETDSVLDTSQMFNYTSLRTVPLFDTSLVTDMNSMFSYNPYLREVPQFDTSSVQDMQSMFFQCYSLKTIPTFNTPNLQNISYMFYQCYSLESVPLFNTSLVTGIDSTFAQCSSLREVPLFDFSSVTDIVGVFSNCYLLEEVPLFDFSSVTTINDPFSHCSSLKTIPQFDFSSLVNCFSFLTGCDSLEYIPPIDFSSAAYVGKVVHSSIPTNVIVDNMQFNLAMEPYQVIEFLGVSRIKSTTLANTNIIITGPMSRPALLELFNNLGLGGGKFVNVGGCEGSVELTPADIAIATGKNWVVTL